MGPYIPQGKQDHPEHVRFRSTLKGKHATTCTFSPPFKRLLVQRCLELSPEALLLFLLAVYKNMFIPYFSAADHPTHLCLGGQDHQLKAKGIYWLVSLGGPGESSLVFIDSNTVILSAIYLHLSPTLPLSLVHFPL